MGRVATMRARCCVETITAARVASHGQRSDSRRGWVETVTATLIMLFGRQYGFAFVLCKHVWVRRGSVVRSLLS
eukprot:10520613-Lingulodinium_polyedra.AAC.1